MSLLDSWKELIELRTQTHAWDMDRTVSKQDIDDILAEVHRRSPAKQNRVHYKLSILDYSDPEFRNTYYEFCVDRDNPDHRYNSQVLAPYLLVFSMRDPGEFAADFSNIGFNEYVRQLSCIEAGLAADFIVHAAAARGLNCGFCRCYDFNYRPNVIKSKLGLKKLDDIIVSVGLGYASDKDKTLNPYTNIMVDAPIDPKWQSEPKPDISEYVSFIK